MKKIGIIAAFAAVITAVLLYMYLSGLEKQQEVVIEYETILVAAQEIPAYTRITADMVTEEQIPKGGGHALVLRSAENAIGKMVQSEILQGEQILSAKLTDTELGEDGLSYILENGMRALTIAVDSVSGVSGFIRNGDYVDILCHTDLSSDAFYEATGLEKSEDEEETIRPTSRVTLVCAQNIEVAAAGSSYAKNTTETGDGGSYTYLTVFVTPRDAMRIVQGYRAGSLTVVLRAVGDHEPNTQIPIDNDDLAEPAYEG
ncbi:MAG: Flp pilus assembly protein CpaB [Clostridiaceae bacterium]|nr:Flp pilus assembly protein CpaB [Clostridiaceae bacterium]